MGKEDGEQWAHFGWPSWMVRVGLYFNLHTTRSSSRAVSKEDPSTDLYFDKEIWGLLLGGHKRKHEFPGEASLERLRDDSSDQLRDLPSITILWWK